GIRDLTVTGVQTCALPILPRSCGFLTPPDAVSMFRAASGRRRKRDCLTRCGCRSMADDARRAAERDQPLDEAALSARLKRLGKQIGRASCRERVLVSGGLL